MTRARDKARHQDLNGTELILDADADTSITADTDDQIDIRIAGVDDRLTLVFFIRGIQASMYPIERMNTLQLI